MNTFLLVWNPKLWVWEDLDILKSRVERSGFATRDWSCGNVKKIRMGDRIFIIRLGQQPKGIFASGIVEVERHLEPHWDPKKHWKIGYITVRFDKLLNPLKQRVLPRTELEKPDFQPMHWSSQMSGVEIPAHIAENLEKAWKMC